VVITAPWTCRALNTLPIWRNDRHNVISQRWSAAVTDIFPVQGFGALSEFSGQFANASATQSFQTMAQLGANSVALTDRIWTSSKTGNAVFEDPAKSETDASLLAGFQAAHAAGLSVTFRPGITGLDSTISSSLAPSDPDSFFASYKAEIVHLATIAQQGGVATFAIGNELGGLSGAQYLPEWTNLIAAVRQVYHGQLTYTAATDEASHVSFWSQLDKISVNAYPPLTSSTTPTVQELAHSWHAVPFNSYYAAAFEFNSPIDFLHSLSLEYGKQVMISEVGYRSIDGTAINPGGGSSKAPADAAEQADAYNALFQVLTSEGGTWLQGAELWQFDLNGVPSPTGYSPVGKPAQDVVSQYFHGAGLVPGLVVTGSAIGDTIDVGSGNDIIQGGLGHDNIYAGAGDDVIVAGPSTAGRLTTTTLSFTGYGTVVDGVGAQAQILVNGQAVSGLLEFHTATDPSGYQTFNVTFDNPAQVNNVDISLTNSVPGRALHIKDVSINGVELHPGDATNASSPGSFDLYVRNIDFNTTGHQDLIFGASTDNDFVRGYAGNDTITGGIGNDIIDGGSGIDTARYSGKAADYTIGHSGSQLTVADSVAGRDGTDSLVNVEFLKFAETTVATSALALKQGEPAVLSAAGSPATAPVAGATVTSTTANDVMTGGGGETFVFKEASGHDVINGFRGGEAAGHDVIRIASSVVADLAHLATHVDGQNTMIELGHDATITLAGFTGPLTPHDVLIV
jgi:Ca2+-binding RTX toxin-like protein